MKKQILHLTSLSICVSISLSLKYCDQVEVEEVLNG